MYRFIHSTQIYTRYGLRNGYLKICGDRITDILDAPDEEGEVTEYYDERIIPGIIDIHNHGYGGWSMTDSVTDKDLCGYAKACASIGITTVLPTTTKESPGIEGIVHGIKAVSTGARIYGIYSEGPFWARGGENTVGETWPKPSVETVSKIIERAEGKLKVMAIAPELPGAEEVIHLLHQKGIKVAACHTKADSEQIRKAMHNAGFEIVTHLCNGMQGIHHRNVGALGAYLLEDSLYYEIICDLNHVCADMLKLLFRLQPYAKYCLISDSNFISGLPAGVYERYGELNYSYENGLIVDKHHRIRGSGKCVLHNMKMLTETVGVPFEEAVRMASSNPAGFLGIDGLTGTIEPGKVCDLAVISDDYRCLATYVAGKKVFDCRSDLQVFNTEAMSLRRGDIPEGEI